MGFLFVFVLFCLLFLFLFYSIFCCYYFILIYFIFYVGYFAVIYTSCLSHAIDNIFLDKQSPWTKGLTVIIECGRNVKLVNAIEFDQKDVKQGVAC